MDPKQVIEQHYKVQEYAGVRVAKCNTCGKELVLRAGTAAVTRLVSHVGQHGLLFSAPTAVRK